jgi:lipopolysaccharide export system protein LptA
MLLAPALVLAAAGSAQAQLSAKRGPIDYSAEGQEWRAEERTLVLTGNVDIVQDDTRLRADTVSLILRPEQSTPRPAGEGPGADDVQKIIAQGDVHLTRVDQHIRGDEAVYDDDADTVTFTNNVIIATKDLVSRGELLVYEVASGVARMNPNRRPGERVKGRFNAKPQE